MSSLRIGSRTATPCSASAATSPASSDSSPAASSSSRSAAGGRSSRRASPSRSPGCSSPGCGYPASAPAADGPRDPARPARRRLGRVPVPPVVVGRRPPVLHPRHGVAGRSPRPRPGRRQDRARRGRRLDDGPHRGVGRPHRRRAARHADPSAATDPRRRAPRVRCGTALPPARLARPARSRGSGVVRPRDLLRGPHRPVADDDAARDPTPGTLPGELLRRAGVAAARTDRPAAGRAGGGTGSAPTRASSPAAW